MAIKVLDLELTGEKNAVSIPKHYRQAFVLLRLKGRPIAAEQVDVHDGVVDLFALKQRVVAKNRWSLWRQWCSEVLTPSCTEAAGRNQAGTVTVAVCTRERPGDLKMCLDALMRLPDDGQEYIVIDNAPLTDATRSLVTSYPCVRYICEPQAGLDRARNRALREARHEIVAFCDDDAMPDVGWLRALLTGFSDPLVVGVTGLTLPYELETAAQEWFERYGGFSKGFRRKTFDGAWTNPLHVGHIGAGANMALRQSVIDTIGPFDEALDCGTPTRSGGDHDMFSRILQRGYRLVYEPQAISWHRHRRTWKELRNTLYGYGVGVYARLAKQLLLEGEPGVLAIAWSWFRRKQLPEILRSIRRRRGRKPLDLLMAELAGCVTGPWCYARARWLLRQGK